MKLLPLLDFDEVRFGQQMAGLVATIGEHVEPRQDCFGVTISVPGQGVTFCFEGRDATTLERIQLYPG